MSRSESIIKIMRGKNPPIHYKNLAAAAKDNGMTPMELLELIDEGRPSGEARYVYARLWTGEKPVEEKEGKELRQTSPAPAAAGQMGKRKEEKPAPRVCPLRRIQKTETGEEWRCAGEPSGRFYCQTMDLQACKIYEHFRLTKKAGEI